MAGSITNPPISSSLAKLQSLNGLFAIYKKQGPTSADVLNTLKEALLKGDTTGPNRDRIRKPLCVYADSDSDVFNMLCSAFRGWRSEPEPAKKEEAEPEDGTRRDAGQRCQRGAG